MTVLPDDEFSLAAEFPDASRDEWQRLVEGVLRKTGAAEVSGPAVEDVLATALEDGLTARPLYTASDFSGDTGCPGAPPFVRGGRPEGNALTGWDVRQHHRQPDARRCNEEVLADLENGVTSLWLSAGAAGVPVEQLPEALDGVHLDLAPVVLDAGAEFDAAARELLRLYEKRSIPPRAALGNLGADPLALLARTGDESDLDGQSARAARLAVTCHGEYPGLRALTVDALPYHEAGASAAQELGASIATGVAYLREMTAAGLTAEAACGQLEFRYAATADQFLTIAKLRAARRLWARVAQVCSAGSGGGDGSRTAAQRQHAVTSPVMMARRDPWVNMLRTTVACLAAGVGGADAVTVLPFDSALGLPDAFARRIARNTSSILLEESHLAQVIDPAGGSWYVERMTDELAHAAWEFFQEIENAGGQAAAWRSGLLAERLAQSWERRSADLAHRREPVTGVSEFPHLAEEPVERAPAPREPGGGLPKVRRDEAFETLRARSDAHSAATGARPRVFIAALGPAAAHTARVGFVSNLLQAGGIEPVHDPETVDEASAAEAFRRSGAKAACLCSSDRLYSEQAEGVAAALVSAGADPVLLAGRPSGPERETYLRAGVGEFVFSGGDAVALLSSVLDRLGVA
ncbi:methylmalonyl-CoA mutase family protein [Streptomyces ovatisporus]|uniref:Methylmalonyl-CoA mutase family protein n=1 Tax=Streptomyces ovatisporus TaxID=1128682 RepID=A0ABV9A3A7_9ACTN